MADLKIGDAIRLKKDGARAVVTNDYAAAGRKQERIEYRREDNGSVYECWVDEVARVAAAAPASAPAEREAPAKAEEPVRLVRVGDDKPKGRTRKAN